MTADESGSESDGENSASSSYVSLSEFASDQSYNDEAVNAANKG